MLRERLKGRSLRFSGRERALLARKAFGIPRKVLLSLQLFNNNALLTAYPTGEEQDDERNW